jgi:hypothetical protein
MDKVELNLAKPTPEAMAKLYERLTGKKLSPEGLKQLQEAYRSRRSRTSTR